MRRFHTASLSALLLLLMLAMPGLASAQSIDKAYQKEFAYLQAQKSALQKRLADLERRAATDGKAEQAELAGLQNRLVQLQLRADGLQEQLAEIEREAVRTDESSESLAAVFEQARASLQRYDVDVAVPDNPGPDEVRELFAAAMPVLEAGGKVHTAPGTYFLADGQRAEGDITRVGRIAAFADDVPLAPAGEGRLKVWADAKPGGIFLFESVEKAVEQKTEQTWLDTIQAGGIIAWVIVVLGALALLLVVWRAIALLLATSPRDFVDEVSRLVGVGRYVEARRLADSRPGAAARVVRRTIEVLDEPREVVDDAVAEAILDEQGAVDRFGTAIMVFAAVAPLLGLLGTVTGMIATFDIITEYGTGDPKMLSSGISEALITTQLGLMVAIPTLLVGNLLNAKAASLLEGFEQSALRVLNSARSEPVEEPVEETALSMDRPLLEATG